MSALRPRVRVAVLGAGVTGASFVDACLGRLGVAAADVHVFEMGRGPGGRCATRRGARHGTPAFAVGGGGCDKFARAVADLEARGLVHRWTDAALSVVDARSLGERGAGAATKVSDHETSDYSLYRVGSSMCQELLQHETSTLHFDTCVHGITREATDALGQRQDTDKRRWFLRGSDGEALGFEDGFDWIVVTSLVAANEERWRATFGGPPPLGKLQDALRHTGAPPASGMDLSDATCSDVSLAHKILDGMNETRVRPVLTSINMFSASSDVGQALAKDYPFDLAHVESDPVLKKIVKETTADGETIAIMAHSTENFAETVGPLRTSHSSVSKISALGASNQAKQAAVAGEMEYALANVIEQWVPGFAHNLRHADNTDGDLQYKSLHRWGAAFPEPVSYFTDENTGDLSYVMPSMGLAVCGDFLGPGGTPGKVQAAVMSGRDAADKFATATD